MSSFQQTSPAATSAPLQIATVLLLARALRPEVFATLLGAPVLHVFIAGAAIATEMIL